MSDTQTRTRPTDRPVLTPAPPSHLDGPRSHDVPAWWPVACQALVWASMLVVVTLWLAGGGLTGLSNVWDVLSTSGRLTALLASDLLLIQTLLMARIPFVERSFGQDA